MNRESTRSAAHASASGVPRDTEPCGLVAFCGIVAGGAAAAVCAAGLLGWSIHAALKWAGWM